MNDLTQYRTQGTQTHCRGLRFEVQRTASSSFNRTCGQR